MSGFANFGEFISSQIDSGSERFSGFRKLPNQVTTAGIWFDLSMSPGSPIPQYYATTPLTSTVLSYSSNKGLYHGANVSSAYKYLDTFQVSCAGAVVPMPIILCDYLMYYSFVDEGTTDPQPMTNSASLTRYTDGVGVKIMAVSLGARTGGQTFSVSYTNSNGVSGRTTTNAIQNTVSVNGSIVTSATATSGSAGPFLALQSGDIGVRSIESVTMNGTDVGLFALVLVKPLFQTMVVATDCPVENQTLIMRKTLPRIYDDAYLNMICLPQGSLSAVTIFGYLKCIYN